MAKPSAIFRADASPQIGGGHVMRCLTLADALAQKGWDCAFACTPETPETVPLLKQKNYRIISPDQAEPADWLVVDHYGLDRIYEAACRKTAKQILVIDDLADRPHDCDVLVDQTYGRSAVDYKTLTPAHCNILTGPAYALLRPQFAALREASLKRRRDHTGEAQHIFVFLGTGDPDQVTEFVVDALATVKTRLRIDVVVGKATQSLAHYEPPAANFMHNLSLHTQVGNIAELMARADFAIGAGGTASWERCCMGLPAITVEIADNQRKIAAALDKVGATINMGWYEDMQKRDLVHAIADLVKSPDKVAAMSQKAAAICDGQGARRLVEIIENGGQKTGQETGMVGKTA